MRDRHGLGKPRGLGDGLLGDVHFRADADDVIKLDDIGAAHADTAEAGGRADAPLLGRAVNVNVPAVGVAVAGLEALEPEDSGNDRVAAGSIGPEDFAGLALVLEDGAGGRVAADFSGDPEFAQRRAAAAGSVTQAELGSGYRVLGDRTAFIEEELTLLRDADDDAMPGVLLGATGEEEEEEDGDWAEDGIQQAAGRRHENE